MCVTRDPSVTSMCRRSTPAANTLRPLSLQIHRLKPNTIGKKELQTARSIFLSCFFSTAWFIALPRLIYSIKFNSFSSFYPQQNKSARRYRPHPPARLSAKADVFFIFNVYLFLIVLQTRFLGKTPYFFHPMYTGCMTKSAQALELSWQLKA